MALSEIDSQLWDIPDFFRKHLRDLLLGDPVNEADPKLVLMRMPQLTGTSPLQVVISYCKKRYDSR
jgi:hypothetical protein